jgi:hypothetical protein
MHEIIFSPFVPALKSIEGFQKENIEELHTPTNKFACLKFVFLKSSTKKEVTSH